LAEDAITDEVSDLNLRAAGVNDADLAEIAGHRVETMLARIRTPLALALKLCVRLWLLRNIGHHRD
jgi:hypothetical protein